MSLLEVKGLTHGYGDKLLYKNAGFSLYNGEHMGLVGQNGAGKSTLVGMLAGQIVPDSGEIRWSRGIKIGHLDQYATVDESLSISEYLKSAYASLYEMEARMNDIYEQLLTSQDEKLIRKAASYQETLEKADFYAIGSHVNKVASGLGLTAMGLDTKLSTLSGGQRAKVILAKLLLDKPDVLLMDEPTNFLDSEHIEWLSKYLKGFEGAYIVVSHDFNFLEEITSCILDVEFLTIQKYSGSYSKFTKQKAQRHEEYVKQYESQKKFIERTEDYIARNKARAATAAMAQSRQKQLDKIERMAPPPSIVKPTFAFPYIPLSSQVVLKTSKLEVGYYYAILPELSFSITNGQKVVIKGFNGIGKSTLLKTLVGEIGAVSGKYKFADAVKISYFEQNILWESDRMTPVEIICDQFPQLNTKQARKVLARCGVKAEHAVQAVGTLSGGEQTKVKLCALVQNPCNLLILDEPTNHLDALAKEALGEAIAQFEGTVILVSHEPPFYEAWADKIIDIEKLFD